MKDKTNYITQEQFQQLLDNIPKLTKQWSDYHVQLLFKVIYEGGLRVSEALQLNKSDLDIEHKQLVLRETKGGKRRCKCSKWKKNKLIKVDKDCKKCNGIGKYRVKEYAWLTPDTFDELVKFAEQFNDTEEIFPMSRQSVWLWSKLLGELIGVKMLHEEKETTNFFPHALRHSRPIHMLQTGKFTINEIMGKLRHKSLQPTTTYVTMANESIQAKEAEL